MKKIKMLLAAIACIAISASAVAQGTVDLDKMSKEERKAYEAKQDSIEHVAAVDALKSGNWMLIAEQRDGKILSEREKPLNFLVVENNETILFQTGANSSGGNNTMGGVTVDAKLKADKSKIEEKKNGELKAKFEGSGTYMNCRIQVKLSKVDGYAEISLSDNRCGAFVDLRGTIMPLNKNKVRVGKMFVPTGSGKWSGAM